MFDKLKARRLDAKDEKLLAQYAGRDAKLGLPTPATLTERALAAARAGHWKTALASIRQGGDPNATVEYKLDPEDLVSTTVRHPASFFAVEQDRPDALEELFRLGAAPAGCGDSRLFFGRWDKQTLLEFAALHGSAGTMSVLLAAGGCREGGEPLDKALAIAAARPGQSTLVETLLAQGAKGFETALLAAEKIDNGDAIRLIRSAEKTAGAGAPDPVEIDLARREKALETALTGLETADRRLLLERLKNKFAADFAAITGKTGGTAAPLPPRPVKISIKV